MYFFKDINQQSMNIKGMIIYYEKLTNLDLFSGTQFACSPSGKTAGCFEFDGKQTCYCEGAECNTYTKANVYNPGITIFIEILSYFFILQGLTTSKMRKFQTMILSQVHKAKTC